MSPARMNPEAPRSLDRCISYLEQLKARVEMIRRLSKELLK